MRMKHIEAKRLELEKAPVIGGKDSGVPRALSAEYIGMLEFEVERLIDMIMEQSKRHSHDMDFMHTFVQAELDFQRQMVSWL
ncbi:hypothetical protein LCGC14_2719610 [marine sediment metagenome]|uniref:Uncharacterized protein n=1 Tax=marine sediment metagenome TaxID=412755 RepID=A0A0F9BJL2_9ZZZZ